jgi:hypothetical protein
MRRPPLAPDEVHEDRPPERRVARHAVHVRLCGGRHQHRTFQSWTRRGRLDQRAGRDTAFAAFVRDLKRAEAAGIAERLKLINRAARRDWRAAHAVNVSRYPKYFAAKRHQVRLLRKELAEVKETLKLLLSGA